MFTDFFLKLRDAKVPVTLKEHLTLIEGLQAGVCDWSVESFYYLSRATLVKDEIHLDKFDRIFGEVFKGIESLSPEALLANIPEEWLKKLTEKFLTEEEKRQIKSLGGWDKLTADHLASGAKLDQLFGIAFSRQPDAEAFDSDNDAEGSQDASARVVDFGQGPAVFDLDAGEDVKPIQSQNPATNTQDFLKLCMQIALKCLDLPATFLFEDITNYSGARGAWTLFERSCHARRKTQERLHRKLTRWLLLKWTLPVEFGGTGELALPGSLTAADLQFKWVPRGIAFWKPQEELDVSLRCVAAGLQSMQDVCDERGFGDYLDNVAEIQKERNELATMGFLQQWSNSAMVRLEAAT